MPTLVGGIRQAAQEGAAEGGSFDVENLGTPQLTQCPKGSWCAEELGLTTKRIEAGGQFGVLNDAEYVAMNPNKLVPIINDGGFVLWESNVIVRYLSQKYGFDTLCPSGSISRFDGERWMDWQATTLWPALRPLFIGLIRTVPEKRDPKVMAAVGTRCGE